MTWKAIGQSVAGTSHEATGKGCEDSLSYLILNDADGQEVLVCCVSDGAGSASEAAYASAYATEMMRDFAALIIRHGETLSEAHAYALAEDIYYGLEAEATTRDKKTEEYSCTLVGCIITSYSTLFLQIGDGAIICDDGNDGYHVVWWPENGEYHNTTNFVTDDPGFGNLKVKLVSDPVTEVALITDGLQLLALNTETRSVHQPFFRDMFRYLRKADDEDKTGILNRKLAEFLTSERVNERTDDDKTLVMATRLNT